ncbi:hypothetical protein [Comamonas sp. CMM02]|uniref:hypothetical protein n=1 Tax=Comamonas sp. CMM02 TaxID=2769307 RepID=UPI00177D47F0|nr:hypothetical protein [Comamonas sp. CMM02]MBD9402467.1 hypothetical protein [Comamonas sp. CMM02]
MAAPPHFNGDLAGHQAIEAALHNRPSSDAAACLTQFRQAPLDSPDIQSKAIPLDDLGFAHKQKRELLTLTGLSFQIVLYLKTKLTGR